MLKDEDLLESESTFSPYSVLENLKKANLDPSIFETIDERDFPKAPNFLEFAIGPQYLNTLILPKQIQIGSYLFCDFCPRCSKPAYIDNLFDQTVGNIRDNVVFLDNGVCPICKITRYELIQKKEVIFRNELVGVAGQRCIPKDSLVYSDKGLLPLEDITEEDTLTHGPVLKKIDSGLLPAIKLNTQYSYSLVGAKDSHIVPIIKDPNKGIEYRPIASCEIGDYLLLNKADFWPQNTPTFDNTSFDPCFKYPGVLTLELAKVLGYIYSKPITQCQNGMCFEFDLDRSSQGTAILEDYKKSFQSCFEWPPIPFSFDDSFFKCGMPPYVVKWLYSLGFTLTERNIPQCILTAPKEFVQTFIKAFLGNRDIRSYKSSLRYSFDYEIFSSSFIKQFRLLLLNMGYISDQMGNTLLIYAKKETPVKLKDIVPENYFPVEIKSIQTKLVCHMMDVQIPDTNLYTADGFVHHNSGKTKLVALLAAYVNHRFLKIPSPVRAYNQTAGDVLMGTFSALSLDHSYRNLWQAFKGFIDSSPWFQNYHRFLKNEEKRVGIELFHELKASMFYTHKHLLWNAVGSQDRKMRGDTRIFAAIDELGWMISDEQKKDLQNMNADAIYTALSNSLTTMRTKYQQVWNSTNFDIPPILMTNISSPSSVKDKIMRLLKDAKRNDRILPVHLATYEMNPDYTYESLREEMAHIDEATFMRDFGAEPPLAANPYLSEPKAIDKIAVGDSFSGITVTQYVENDFLGDPFKSLKVVIQKPDKIIPRLLTFDLGSFKNSLAICMFSLNVDMKPRLDFAAVIRPDPKEKIRANISKVFDDFTVPLVNAFKIRHVFFDRWQSLDQVERLKGMGVDAAIHSLTYKEMDSLRGAVLSQSIIIPKLEKPMETYVKEYVDDIQHSDPYVLLGLQFLTVRDLGHKMSKPLLGDDDMFRAFCLGAVKLSESSIKQEYLNNGNVKLNSGLTIAHLGVVRTRRGGGGFGMNSVEGENGKHLGSIRTRLRK